MLCAALLALVLLIACQQRSDAAPSPLPSTDLAAAGALPSIAITVDLHDPSEAAAVMRAHGLVGTYFTHPSRLDAVRAGKLAGWSIGAYSMRPMTGMAPTAARQALQELSAGMAAAGYPVRSLAAGSRLWDRDLRDAASGVFERVRVARNVTAWQALPVADPLWIDGGGTASLGEADTAASLAAQLADLQARGGLWIVVVHKVGPTGDGYTVRRDVFDAFCAAVAREVRAGRLALVTM